MTAVSEPLVRHPPVPVVRPLPLAGALVYFGIPAAVFTASLFLLLPWLLARGVSPFATFQIAFGGPLALMLLAALVVYRLEGNPWTWAAFRDRTRLRKLDRRGWLWTIGLCVFALVLSFVLSGPIQGALQSVRFYTPPRAFADFMAQAVQTRDAFLGVPLGGNWALLLYFLAILFFLNILGEELWWRGIILPRQELVHGRRTWMIHGVLWTAFHIFYHNNLGSVAAMLPGTCALSYVCQRTQSTWPGIMGHFVTNLGIPVLLLRGILR